MNNIQVTDYLTWEYCEDPEIQYLNCSAPEPVRNHMPQWFKDLKARRDEVTIAEQQTIRNCLGFRGLASIGYTIPLPETITTYNTHFNRGRLQPAMIEGTVWANKTPDGTPGDPSAYEYCMRLLYWPWRARMAPGWRLLILPYLMDWDPNWQSFSGTVEPNYMITRDGTGIGSGLQWTQPIDTQYNYYNLETVVAFRRSSQIPAGTVTFTAVPIYDPTLPANCPTWNSWTCYQANQQVYYKGDYYRALDYIERAPEFQAQYWEVIKWRTT
jgi:hypothetical protein